MIIRIQSCLFNNVVNVDFEKLNLTKEEWDSFSHSKKLDVLSNYINKEIEKPKWEIINYEYNN